MHEESVHAPFCQGHRPYNFNSSPLRGLIGVGAAARRQGIQLVKEQHAGLRCTRPRKELAHRALALAHVLVQQLWALSAAQPCEHLL